jgi:integration host factor subunit beta
MITRSELTDRITSRFPQLSHADVKTCVDSMLAAMTKTLAKGERIEVRGFGSFDVVQRKPRIGRNPKTGVRVHVPAKRMPHFKAGKQLRDEVKPVSGIPRSLRYLNPPHNIASQ